MNKFGNCPLCGKQVKPANLRKIARQNQLYGFRMALDGIASTWGALIQMTSLRVTLLRSPASARNG
nr:MAG TPA: Rad50 zinc hook motif [Caudoviricetes sp.]